MPGIKSIASIFSSKERCVLSPVGEAVGFPIHRDGTLAASPTVLLHRELTHWLQLSSQKSNIGFGFRLSNRLFDRRTAAEMSRRIVGTDHQNRGDELRDQGFV